MSDMWGVDSGGRIPQMLRGGRVVGCPNEAVGTMLGEHRPDRGVRDGNGQDSVVPVVRSFQVVRVSSSWSSGSST